MQGQGDQEEKMKDDQGEQEEAVKSHGCETSCHTQLFYPNSAYCFRAVCTRMASFWELIVPSEKALMTVQVVESFSMVCSLGHVDLAWMPVYLHDPRSSACCHSLCAGELPAPAFLGILSPGVNTAWHSYLLAWHHGTCPAARALGQRHPQIQATPCMPAMEHGWPVVYRAAQDVALSPKKAWSQPASCTENAMKGVQSSLHVDPGHPQCFVSKWHNSSYSEGVSGSHQLLQRMAHQGFPSRVCVESCVQDGPVKKIPLCFQFVSKCSPLPSCHTVCPRSGKSGVCFSLSKILGFINTIFLPCTGDPLYHDHLGFPRPFSTLLPSWNSGHSLFLLISSLLWLLMAFGYVLLPPTLKRSQGSTPAHHLTVAVVLSEAVP